MRRQNLEIVFLDCTIRVYRSRNGSRCSTFVNRRRSAGVRKCCTGSHFCVCKLGLCSLEIQFPDSVFAFYTGNPSRIPCCSKRGVFGVIRALLGCLWILLVPIEFYAPKLTGKRILVKIGDRFINETYSILDPICIRRGTFSALC
jgi:hypothetical protein